MKCIKLNPGWTICLALSLCSVVITACGGGDGNSEPAALELNDSVLIGTWVAQCLPLGMGQSTRGVSRYNTDGTFSITTESYQQENCLEPAFEIIRSGSYIERARTEIESRGVQTAIDQTSESYALKPQSQTVVDSFNELAICGFNDWEVDVTFVTSGCLNDGVSPIIGIEVPYTEYNIVLRERDQLFFGNEVSFAASNRPLDLMPFPVLVRSTGAIGDELAAELLGFWNVVFNGEIISYIQLSNPGRIIGYTPDATGDCFLILEEYLFEIEGEGRYRNAFNRLFYTILPIENQLLFELDDFTPELVLSRETTTNPDDFVACI